MITGGVASELDDRPGILGIGLLAALAVIPVVDHNEQLQEQFLLGGITAIQAYGLQFVWRYCGVFSMAFTALSGVGAYVAVIMAMHAGAPFWLGALAAIPVSIALGAIVGLAALRTSGMHFVMLTYALVAALEVVADNGGSFSGGTSGLTLFKPMDLGFLSLSPLSEVGPYVLIYVLLLLSVLAVVGLRYLRIGKRLIASRDNEMLARALGLRVFVYRVLVIALSGIGATLAGSVYAFHEYHVEPDLFGATASLQVLVALILGGMTRWSGPIIGAALTVSIPQYLGLSPLATQITYGVILIVVVMAIPGGASGAPAQVRRWLENGWNQVRHRVAAQPNANATADASSGEGGSAEEVMLR
jgi:branched-chain amino acid transport system permease protein